MPRDLTDARAIKLKGALFLVAGVLATAALVALRTEPAVLALHAIAVWCFCRFYYFAFYVIEKYVDPGYRFSGLGSFALYCLRGRAATRGNEASR